MAEGVSIQAQNFADAVEQCRFLGVGLQGGCWQSVQSFSNSWSRRKPNPLNPQPYTQMWATQLSSRLRAAMPTHGVVQIRHSLCATNSPCTPGTMTPSFCFRTGRPVNIHTPLISVDAGYRSVIVRHPLHDQDCRQLGAAAIYVLVLAPPAPNSKATTCKPSHGVETVARTRLPSVLSHRNARLLCSPGHDACCEWRPMWSEL